MDKSDASPISENGEVLEESVASASASGSGAHRSYGSTVDMKPENLRKRARPLEKTRGGERHRFQDKKGRSVGASPEATEIGTEAMRGVQAGVQATSDSRPKYSLFGSCDTPWQIEEKSLQALLEDLFKTAPAQDRKKEARESQRMGQEDANSQWRHGEQPTDKRRQAQRHWQ